MSDFEKNMNQLNNLSDAIVENIINTPDDEILNEVKEEYGDPLFKANSMREKIKKAKINAGKQRFQNAQNELKAFDAESGDNNDYGENLSEIENMTLAARNGEDLSESDQSGLYEDFNELKKLKKWKNEDNK